MLHIIACTTFTQSRKVISHDCNPECSTVLQSSAQNSTYNKFSLCQIWNNARSFTLCKDLKMEWIRFSVFSCQRSALLKPGFIPVTCVYIVYRTLNTAFIRSPPSLLLFFFLQSQKIKHVYTSEFKPYVVFVKPPRLEELRLTRRRAESICDKDDENPVKIFSVRETQHKHMCVTFPLATRVQSGAWSMSCNMQGGVRSDTLDLTHPPNPTHVHTTKVSPAQILPDTWPTLAFKRHLRGMESYNGARWVAFRFHHYKNGWFCPDDDRFHLVCICNGLREWPNPMTEGVHLVLLVDLCL